MQKPSWLRVVRQGLISNISMQCSPQLLRTVVLHRSNSGCKTTGKSDLKTVLNCCTPSASNGLPNSIRSRSKDISKGKRHKAAVGTIFQDLDPLCSLSPVGILSLS